MNESFHRSAFARFFEASVFGAALFATACSGANDPEGDAAGDFETLTAVQYPGFVQGSPVGSSCHLEEYAETETLDGALRVLTWDYCAEGANSALHEPHHGQRSLTDDEYASVVDAVSQVTPSNANTCGADASVVTIDVVTTTGTELYANDFYSGCPWEVHEGRTFAKGVVDVGILLGELARM